MVVILTRSIDLSMAANLAFTGMAVAMINAAYPGFPIPLLILVACLIGLALGALNGVLVWKIGIPSIVVTLGTLTIYRGAIFVLSGGAWVNADQMSPDFIGLQRAAAARHPGAVVVRHRGDRGVLRGDDAHAARPLALCDRRQPDRRRSMPASMSAAPSSSPSASPGWSAGSPAISGSRAT